MAQHTWKGRESRGSGGKQAHTKQALTFSAVVTHVPSAVPKLFPPLPFIALSQFFVPWPHTSFFRAAHTHCDCTNSTDKGFVLLAHSTLQSLLTPRSRSESRYRSETSDQLQARPSGVSRLIITNHKSTVKGFSAISLSQMVSSGREKGRYCSFRTAAHF